jgi:amino acid transporter
MDSTRKADPPIAATLGLGDSTSIIVGIIIGVGIFAAPASIFRDVPDVWTGLGVWLLGGVVALIGALCFAELATAYPRSGGEYIYLTRAFGPLAGFLFAWAQLTVIRPGSIAAVAYIFALYANSILGLGASGVFVLAALSIIILTIINVLGVVLGAWTQNLLTLAKVLGLVALVAVGFAYGSSDNLAPNPTPSSGPWSFAMVMMFVLWAYSGWQEAAYVVAEVKDRRRNIPLALLLGTTLVTIIYLAVNLAYLYGLGFAAIQRYQGRFAVELVAQASPRFGAQAMAVLVIVSALGAINGMIFTTARIYAEFGLDHRLFSPLSHWSRRLGTPARALIVQGIITLLLIVGVFLYEWWNPSRLPVAAVNTIGLLAAPGGLLSIATVAPFMPTSASNTFDTMLEYTAAVFWFFFLLTGVAFFVLRRMDHDVPRPFRVPLYPIIPLAFCGACAAMTIGVIVAEPQVSLTGLCILLAGLPFYFWPRRKRRQPAALELEPVGR